MSWPSLFLASMSRGRSIRSGGRSTDGAFSDFIECFSMLAFLRELLAHAEWANAVFFHAWGKSPARDHEEMRRRVEHIIGVQQGFLSILRGEPTGGPPGGPPATYEELKIRAQTS